MGILFGLGLLWLVGDLVHKDKEDDAKEHFTLVHALTKIDMGSIVFLYRHFAGCGVAGTQPHSDLGAKWLDQAVGRQDVIVTIIGMVSAIVDNVPLVAASMGMYSLTPFPPTAFCGNTWPTAPEPAARF
jgi:Na+/H+ antiporter NhaD/arsenite permease-like protein